MWLPCIKHLCLCKIGNFCVCCYTGFFSCCILFDRGPCLLCIAWVLWDHTTLLFLQQRSKNGRLPKLLLRLGGLGLFSSICRGMLCSGYSFRGYIRDSWYCVWVSCYHHGDSENLAETLPHPHQERTYTGIIYIFFMCYQITSHPHFTHKVPLRINLDNQKSEIQSTVFVLRIVAEYL